jgi:P-type Ca2+ transporter type 2C
VIAMLCSIIPEDKLPGIHIATGQWLWVNIIMDSLAAAAYATDEPDRSVLQRQPESKTSRLSSLVASATTMIIGEAVLMVTVVMGLSWFGEWIIHHTRPDLKEEVGPLLILTLVFNTLIWLVFFNLIK